MEKYIICIDNKSFSHHITIGKIYKVEEETDKWYYITTDFGIKHSGYGKHRFIPYDKKQKIIMVTNSLQLRHFSREALREYAKKLGIKRGRDKEDTIRNLIKSGKAYITISLGGK